MADKITISLHEEFNGLRVGQKVYYLRKELPTNSEAYSGFSYRYNIYDCTIIRLYDTHYVMKHEFSGGSCQIFDYGYKSVDKFVFTELEDAMKSKEEKENND